MAAEADLGALLDRTIKTVQDLGENEFFRAAQLLTQLSEAGAK